MSYSTQTVIPDEAMDTLAYQIDKIRTLYAMVEDFTTEHVWKREEGLESLHPEIEQELSDTLTTLDNMDRVMRQHITSILDGTVTKASTHASAVSSGVADDIENLPLPPSSPRAIAKAKSSSNSAVPSITASKSTVQSTEGGRYTIVSAPGKSSRLGQK